MKFWVWAGPEILRVDVRSQLMKCSVPVLYLQASRDHLVPSSAARTIMQIRPDATVVILDGPHLILQRNPSAACEAICNWWNDHLVSRTAKSQHQSAKL